MQRGGTHAPHSIQPAGRQIWPKCGFAQQCGATCRLPTEIFAEGLLLFFSSRPPTIRVSGTGVGRIPPWLRCETLHALLLGGVNDVSPPVSPLLLLHYCFSTTELDCNGPNVPPTASRARRFPGSVGVSTKRASTRTALSRAQVPPTASRRGGAARCSTHRPPHRARLG